MSDEIRVGERWQFAHYGVPFDIRVTELTLDDDVVHGTLIEGATGVPDDLVIVPTRVVAAGTRIHDDN